MSNMSYCRFCNTYRDLSDCVTAMEDYIEDAEANEISENELSWAQKMYHLCQEFIDTYEEMEEEFNL